MKRWKVLALAAALAVLAGCSGGAPDETPVTVETEAMDTTMQLTAYGSEAAEALDAAQQDIQRLDAMLSATAPDSEISALNRTGQGTLSEDPRTLLARAIEISAQTDGAFDPTVAPLMNAWGFPSKDYHVPSSQTLQTLLPLVNAQAVTLETDGRCRLPAGVQVDMGGIAKGYAAERVMAIFREHGIEHALISLGGNIQALGSKPDSSPWRIGIQDPRRPDALIAEVQIHNRAVVTSGGYLRYFEKDGVRYHHILDPRTGRPADSGLLSVTIVSKDGTLADALSTALFVMGKSQASDYWRAHRNDFDAILVDEAGCVSVTQGIASAVHCTDNQAPEVIA